MANEREAMTLEQVACEMRDELDRSRHVIEVSIEAFRGWTEVVNRTSRHLSRAAEPVYQVTGLAGGDWMDCDKATYDEAAAWANGEDRRRILYTHPPEPARDAARYRWLRQFLSIEDVGDEEMVYALVIDNEGLEDKASRARCWGCAEYHESAPSVDDAVDAAMAQESGDE